MNQINSDFQFHDPSISQPPVKREPQVEQGNLGGNHVNLIVVQKPNIIDDGVQAAKQPPEKVPANHMAVHIPSDALDLEKLSPARFEGAKGVYLGARSNPEESLYARGKLWLGRMKNWIMCRPNEPRIEGVDQSFWGFGKDVAGAGWGFIYDQLKAVRAYGTGLFGFSSDIGRMRSGDAQVEVYRSFREKQQDVAEALEADFRLINEEMDEQLKLFKDALLLQKSEKEEDREEAVSILKKFEKQGISSEEDILKIYHEQKATLVEVLTASLQKSAVQLNPDYIAEREKVETLLAQVSTLEAQLAIAEDKAAKAKDYETHISTNIDWVGTQEFSWKDLDKASSVVKKEEATCASIREKLEPLQKALDGSAKRLREKEAALLDQEGRLMHANLEADAELGSLLIGEATKSAMKTWTWSINDLLKTIQYGCTGLGVLGIPIVSPVALGISLVTGTLSLAMYGEDTVHRSKQAYHAGQVKSALGNMNREEGNDPELGAIRTLIEKNLSYKEKSVKAFFTSLGIVSTLATLSVAAVNVLAVAGVVSASAAAIASPVGWGIGGICLIAGLSFGAYSGAKAIYRFYQEYKTEQLLEEALRMDEDPSASGSDAYNQLFMETINSVENPSISIEDHQRVEAKTLALMEEYCISRENELELLRSDLQKRPNEGDAASSTFDSLFNYYLKDELQSRGYDEGDPVPQSVGETIKDAIEGRILEWIDQETKDIEAIKEDLAHGTQLSKAYQSRYADTFRVVLGELEQGMMRDRVKIANDRIIEKSLLKLIERRPDHGLRILLQRIKQGDEAALKFIEDIGVFSSDELNIIKGSSTASEPRVIELMMKRLGFDV